MHEQARSFGRIARQAEHIRMLPALPRAQDRKRRCLMREEDGDGDRHSHNTESGTRSDHGSRRCGVQPIVDCNENAKEARCTAASRMAVFAASGASRPGGDKAFYSTVDEPVEPTGRQAT
jgi:hypothetical protein